jgi:hypothetical protein
MADKAHGFCVFNITWFHKKGIDVELDKGSPTIILALVYILLKMYQSYDRGKNVKAAVVNVQIHARGLDKMYWFLLSPKQK